MFFLIVATLANPNVIPVGTPRGSKETKAKQNVMVSIDKEQNYYIGTNKVDHLQMDTLLKREIERFRKTPLDTPTVVINADTIAHYGEVFRIMRIAKLNKAKVVATVK